MAQCGNAALRTRDMNFIRVVLLFENSPQCIIWVSVPLEILFLICQFGVSTFLEVVEKRKPKIHQNNVDPK